MFIEEDKRIRTKELTDYVEYYCGKTDFNLVALTKKSRDVSLAEMKCIVVWGGEDFTVE